MNNWSTAKWDKTSSGTYAANALPLQNGWEYNPNIYMLSNLTQPERSTDKSTEDAIALAKTAELNYNLSKMRNELDEIRRSMS